MNIGLDLGTYAFRSLRSVGPRLAVRRCRAVYSVLPDTPAHRKLLDQAAISYAICDSNLILMGDAATELARLFQVAARDLLPNGEIPHADPIARQVIAQLVDALLPVPEHVGSICCVARPVAADSGHAGLRASMDFFDRLIRLRGYVPLGLHAGTALVLADLVSERFTGVGVTVGAARCEISVAYCGQERAVGTVPRGANWGDEQLAREWGCAGQDARGHTFLDREQAAQKKSALTHSVLAPATREERLVTELYRALTADIAAEVRRVCADDALVAGLKQPLAVVCGGGGARLPGFCDLLQGQFHGTAGGLPQFRVRPASSADDAVARGCLIHAELRSEASTSPSRRAA